MHSKIIANRGWIDRKVVIRPKTRLFAALSAVWCLVSPPLAGLLISHQFAPLSGLGVLCWIFLLPHPVFILLAFFYRLTERPEVFRQRILDVNYDLRHLH